MRVSATTRPHALRPLGSDERGLRRLHHITDVRANELGIPIGDEGVIIEQAESTQVVRICVEIELRFPLHNNAPGKAPVFRYPKACERMIQRLKLKRFTGRTIRTKEAMRK